jgi:putative glutamine amidotransferase
VPLVLPVHGDGASNLVDRIDGLVLTGGGDVDPRYYQGDVLTARGVDQLRDGFEVDALRRALELDLPVLAICRGMQILNVTLGGTLVGDLESAIGSDRHWDLTHWDGVSHELTIESDSHLGRIAGSMAEVNSMHHQAVDRIGDGLKVIARSPDGVIEAVEMTDRSFVVGVQWHPECLVPARPHQDLFNAFADAARKR